MHTVYSAHSVCDIICCLKKVCQYVASQSLVWKSVLRPPSSNARETLSNTVTEKEPREGIRQDSNELLGQPVQ